MIDFLHTFYFDVRKSPNECFKMIVDGKVVNTVPTIHAGETSRGMRISLVNFKYDEDINCVAYFKTDYSNDIIRVVPHERNKNTFDIYFPIMKECTYECEIVVQEGKSVISSGVFEGICDREIKDEFYHDYTPSETIESIIQTYDKYSKLYKKYAEQLEGIINKLGEVGDLNSLMDKTYKHDQILPSNRWEINHRLNKMPSVTIIDSGGNMVYGDVLYLNNDKIIVNFSYPFSGVAILN